MEENLDLIQAELNAAADVLNNFLSKPQNIEAINKAAEILIESFKNDGKVLAAGNGGSHCDAMHFTEELTGRYREDRKPFPAIAIAEPAYISCVANDFGYDSVFARYVEALGKKGDVFLAISTSGNSVNIIKAAELAKRNGVKVIALTGKNGGQLADLCDVEIRVAHNGYADRIQEVHIKIIHILVMLVEKGFAS